jgi:branched-chain amino acid transport system substrate-binding protein
MRQIFIFSLFVCWAIGPISAAAQSEVIVKIGHASGGPARSSLSAYSKQSEQGASLAIEELNQQNIAIGSQKVRFQLVAKDDQSNPSVAEKVAKELVEEKVVDVVGHLTSGMSIRASKIYEAAGVPHITPSATNPALTRQGHKTSFRTIPNDAQAMETLAFHAVDKIKLKRTVIVLEEVAGNSPGYGEIVAGLYTSALQLLGGSIVSTERIDGKVSDYTPTLQKIIKLQPDSIFFAGLDGAAGKFLRQIQSLPTMQSMCL